MKIINLKIESYTIVKTMQGFVSNIQIQTDLLTYLELILALEIQLFLKMGIILIFAN